MQRPETGVARIGPELERLHDGYVVKFHDLAMILQHNTFQACVSRPNMMGTL